VLGVFFIYLLDKKHTTCYNNIIGGNMEYINLWIAFAIVFIGLPVIGSIAIHWRPNGK